MGQNACPVSDCSYCWGRFDSGSRPCAPSDGICNSNCGAAAKARSRTVSSKLGVSGSNTNNCLSSRTACKTIRHAMSLASFNRTEGRAAQQGARLSRG
jgi:hypothetical protein